MRLNMVARSRFSTSTVIDSEYLVPWLSAEGPLAYSPTKPPERDYFFQYTWILPGIFHPQVNLREQVRKVLETPGPVVCDVLVIPDEVRGPRLSSMQRPDGSLVSKPLEDLFPFLDRDEFHANMIVQPLPE